MNVYSVSLKGKRPSNEDKHDIIINSTLADANRAPVNFFSVYDGHGGKFVSKFLHNNLSKCFMDKRVQYPLTKKYVTQVYETIQSTFKNKFLTETTQCGSTCLAVIHFEKEGKKYLNVLNTGDSRCVLCRDNFGIPLTKDHKPDWPEEYHRITQLGGKIYPDGDDWRVKDLSVSRAFGDVDAEPYLTCLPDILRYKLEQGDKFIILACDGLWDVLSNQDVVNYILRECYDKTLQTRTNKTINIARKLAELAIAKGSTDNISVVIVFF
jgi:protein phosphatase 2C